jgi:hypothetical protein
LPVYFGSSFGTEVALTDYVYWRTLAYVVLPTAAITAMLYAEARWVRVAAFSVAIGLALHFLWRARQIVLASSHPSIGLSWASVTLLSLLLCWSCWRWMTERQPIQ